MNESADLRVAHLAPPPTVPADLFAFLLSKRAVSVMEAFSDAELPAVAGLSGLLAERFGARVLDPEFRKAVGRGAKRVMEAIGRGHVREDVQINLPGIFSTGGLYLWGGQAPRDRSRRIRRGDRDAWVKARQARGAPSA